MLQVSSWGNSIYIERSVSQEKCNIFPFDYDV